MHKIKTNMKYIFCAFLVVSVMGSCGGSETKTDEQAYTEQKESLEQKEKKLQYV